MKSEELKTLKEDEIRKNEEVKTLKEDDEIRKNEEVSGCLSCIGLLVILVLIIGCIFYFFYSVIRTDDLVDLPEIKIVSMNFAAELNDNSTTTIQQSHLVSARWDLLIRVPGTLIGDYMCLQGNLQASFLYKNVTLVTSSMQSYKLESGKPQLLNVLAIATKEDLSGAVGKDIMDVIKERNEVRFGSRLYLTDCRMETEKGTMSYGCEEATLRFEPGSKIKATAFGRHSTCIINL